MSSVAGVIIFKAKQGKGDEVSTRIGAALPHVEAEKGTPVWLVLRSETETDTVILVDVFSDVESRDHHMTGEAAKLIFATVPELLASQPEIHPANLITQKLISVK